MADWPAAVLWDLDGTLVDTEPFWIESELALAAEHGATWSHEQGLGLVGNALLDSGRAMREQLGLPLTPGQIVDRLVADVAARMSRCVPWRPGAVELLGELRSQAVPCGLVTMSYVPIVTPVLAALPGDTFGAVVTGDAVSPGKPHPEPYLRAAELLGVAPADCLAIEDSDTGARSAEAAGCRVLVVPHHVAVPPGRQRTFANSLTGLDLAALRDLRS